MVSVSTQSLAFALALMLGLITSTKAERQDAFLDRPMPRGIFPFWKPTADQAPKMRDEIDQFHTFQDRLIALEHWMPRQVVLPDGLYDFVVKIDAQSDPHNSMFSPFQNEGGGWSDGPRVTYREFLSDTCSLLGLTWHYDAKRDAFVTDFAWRSNDPRSSRELVDFLTTTQPRPSNELGIPIDKNGRYDNQPTDPWPRALDALLSHPENFPRTWRLRLLDDTKGGTFCPMPGKIIWRGQMLDQHHQPHFVVIKYHPAFSMPGPTASFDCYVFGPDGHFADGAILSDRYEAMSPPSLSLSTSGTTLQATRGAWSVEAAGKTSQSAPAMPIGSFSLASDHIVFSPITTFQGDYLGKKIYSAPQDDGGSIH